MRPIIGVTCSVDQDALRLNMNYYQALEKAGVLPILIPILQHPENLFQLAEILDGILFSGGVDIDPHHYGEEPRMGLGQITPDRDEIEIELCKIFFEKKKPIFGICRGVQLINVALGGTLHQDVKSELKDVLKHYQEAPAYAPTHTVFIERDSLVFSIVGSEKLLVNSFHHQAIKMVSPFLKVVARASDGVIEAVESFDQDHFVLGVQWHPERMFEKHIEHFKLFDRFVKECSKRKR
ncbi:gamma-glutamyl-gamma-aminobutyrate hydrolase family protein [Pseudothermotoga sp.]|nr:gamma-glutamyl-gamma-aminobutyrate hydrolase family protein [Pseudothermotoga sp.]MDW8139949.1 gamma-glutamyl-gamma-aminobutyrate hydrolase family protein [Pseudothermotoga sp.]